MRWKIALLLFLTMLSPLISVANASITVSTTTYFYIEGEWKHFTESHVFITVYRDASGIWWFDGRTFAQVEAGVPVMPSTPPTITDFSSWWQWLAGGDILGFLQAVYVTAFASADIFYGLLIMLVMGAIYIRTRSLILISILWLLIGGVFIVALPSVAVLGVVMLILGVSGLLFQLFRPHSQSY